MSDKWGWDLTTMHKQTKVELKILDMISRLKLVKFSGMWWIWKQWTPTRAPTTFTRSSLVAASLVSQLLPTRKRAIFPSKMRNFLFADYTWQLAQFLYFGTRNIYMLFPVIPTAWFQTDFPLFYHLKNENYILELVKT